LKNPYPSIDRETIRALDPEAIVVLLPGATPQSLARSKATWESMPSLSAVRSRRVYTLTDWYVQLPGPHVGDVARQLAEALHPSASFSATRDDASVMWAAKSVRWDAKSMTLGATLMAFSHTFLTLAAPSLTFASASLALAAPSLAFASTSPTFAAPSLTLVRP
jgi:hypothetical protein